MAKQDGEDFESRPSPTTARDGATPEIRPPVTTVRPPRRPGALRGRIRMAEDFDTFPLEVSAAIHGETK